MSALMWRYLVLTNFLPGSLQNQLPRPALPLLHPSLRVPITRGLQKARAQEVSHLDLEESILGAVANVTGRNEIHTWEGKARDHK